MTNPISTTLQSEIHLSLGRCIQANEQSLAIGARTASKLEQQGEEIRQINDKLENIDGTLGKAEDTTDRLEGCFSGIFRRMKEAIFGKKRIKNPDKPQRPIETTAKPIPIGPKWEPKNEDEALDVLSAQLSQMKVLGQEMGAELETHNRMLDFTVDGTDQLTTRVKKTRSRLKGIE